MLPPGQLKSEVTWWGQKPTNIGIAIRSAAMRTFVRSSLLLFQMMDPRLGLHGIGFCSTSCVPSSWEIQVASTHMSVKGFTVRIFHCWMVRTRAGRRTYMLLLCEMTCWHAKLDCWFLLAKSEEGLPMGTLDSRWFGRLLWARCKPKGKFSLAW